MKRRISLGVNIDHVATLRQQRDTIYPDLCAVAAACEKAGADGITIHLREDRRHIQDGDLFALRRSVKTRLNLEMANSPEIVALALKARPDEVCLVPERRRERTTEGGLDIAGQKRKLAPVIAKLQEHGIVVSLFIEPDIRQIEAAKAIGATCIELHTGRYCNLRGRVALVELKRLFKAASHAVEMDLQVNAGHGLNLANVKSILKMPGLHTLNIGHSIICDAIMVGIGRAVQAMRVAIEII